MKDEEYILKEYLDKKDNLSDPKRGILFAELLKEQLEKHDLKVSEPNVFIKGLNKKFSLLITKKHAKSQLGVYDINEVLAVFKLNAYGIMGDKVADIEKTFADAKNISPKIICFYVALRDNNNYTYPVNEKTLGYPTYCLFKIHNEHSKPTGDWNKLLKEIKNIK